jgi:hypothetical protein
MEKFALITGLFNLAFLLNLPAGYMRGRARKFSPRWFLFIHLPIPFIIAARIISHVDIRYIPLFIFSSVLGQLLGSRITFSDPER